MELLNTFYLISLVVQLIHSIEELFTGFHKKWYLFTMSFQTFLLFELCFSLFWISILLLTNLPFRNSFQAFFLVLMFANGVQHLVWAGFTKKYVPGLVTAVIHIAVFLVFYSRMILD